MSCRDIRRQLTVGKENVTKQLRALIKLSLIGFCQLHSSILIYYWILHQSGKIGLFLFQCNYLKIVWWHKEREWLKACFISPLPTFLISLLHSENIRDNCDNLKLIARTENIKRLQLKNKNNTFTFWMNKWKVVGRKCEGGTTNTQCAWDAVPSLIAFLNFMNSIENV